MKTKSFFENECYKALQAFLDDRVSAAEAKFGWKEEAIAENRWTMYLWELAILADRRAEEMYESGYKRGRLVGLRCAESFIGERMDEELARERRILGLAEDRKRAGAAAYVRLAEGEIK